MNLVRIHFFGTWLRKVARSAWLDVTNIYMHVEELLKYQEKDREQLLMHYKKLYLYKQPLALAYALFAMKNEEISCIRSSIIGEAKIRLFSR